LISKGVSAVIDFQCGFWVYIAFTPKSSSIHKLLGPFVYRIRGFRRLFSSKLAISEIDFYFWASFLARSQMRKIFTMKKILIASLFTMLYSLGSFAQSDYNDLLLMYVDEKYERCLYKAEKYTLDEKTKKEPLPYLFMSMSYFQMSRRDEFKEKYPDSFKNSLKYMKKYSAKDKERVYLAEYEDFFSELRVATISEADLMYDTEKYTKAKSMYDYLVDMDPKDAGALIMRGIVEGAMKSKKESEESMIAAVELLKNKDYGHYKKEQRGLLKEALLLIGVSTADSGDKATAKTWLDLGMELFSQDPEYKVTYDTITG